MVLAFGSDSIEVFMLGADSIVILDVSWQDHMLNW